MAALAMVRRAASRCALMACAAASCALIARGAADAAETEARPIAMKTVCLNAAETREMVKSRRLLEPFAALKSAAPSARPRRCRRGSAAPATISSTSITLLHRDGRLVHVEMEAATGKIASRPAREPRELREVHEPQSREFREPPAKN